VELPCRTISGLEVRALLAFYFPAGAARGEVASSALKDNPHYTYKGARAVDPCSDAIYGVHVEYKKNDGVPDKEGFRNDKCPLLSKTL
jgi:hypothetical protein